MRDRHQARLCAACGAPMARQADACSRCATPWDEPAAPTARSALRTRLRADHGARQRGSRSRSGSVGWRAHAATARKRPVPATIVERSLSPPRTLGRRGRGLPRRHHPGTARLRRRRCSRATRVAPSRPSETNGCSAARVPQRHTAQRRAGAPRAVPIRGSPPRSVPPPAGDEEMQFVIDEGNDNQFHWRLIGDDGSELRGVGYGLCLREGCAPCRDGRARARRLGHRRRRLRADPCPPSPSIRRRHRRSPQGRGTARASR